MLVSIVVSSYNYRRFLAQAIDSALCQTWPSVEVIVVDDQSTDGSRALIEGYGERIEAIFQPNGGQGSAINTGFAHCRGQAIIFLDSDDVLLPTAAEWVTAALGDPAVAKLHWPATEIDEAGAPLGGRAPATPLPRGDLRQQVLEGGPYGYHWPPTSANAWSRALLERILPMPAASFRACPDLYLAALAPLYGGVEATDAPLSLWRRHGSNLSVRDDFAARVSGGIDRDACAMNALCDHAARLGLTARREAWQPHAWWSQIGAAISDIASVVPAGGSFILADQDAWASGPLIAGRTCFPYREKDGRFWGPPADDEEAIAELRRQRDLGRRFFVVAYPHLWYLEHYRGLGAWLSRSARACLSNDRVAIFDLGGP